MAAVSGNHVSSMQLSDRKLNEKKEETACDCSETMQLELKNVKLELSSLREILRPPLWYSGQSFWLQIQRSRVRSPALPDFLSSIGSGTGSTQPREVKLRSYLNKKVATPGSENRD